MNIVQNHMARGWDQAQRDTANTEPTLARPQWEREPAGQSYPEAYHYCHPCGVRWHTDRNDPSDCWMCGRGAEFGNPSVGMVSYTPHNTRGEFAYTGQPDTPAGGCGCEDLTVDAVAVLIADGWDAWKACLEVYGQ